MNIIKIVFTGGPCAGKTTTIEKTKKYLESEGYKVIVVPEAATILKSSGINMKLLNKVKDFQNFILKMQISNESIAQEAANNQDKNVIILYDRGILDNKAYCGNYQKFDTIMQKENISELKSLESYDIVFDLISTAVCAPNKYTLKNNEQREEGIEEAKKIDALTSNAWAGHKNIKIINSNISLEEVFNIVKDEINNLINKKNKKLINKIYINNSIKDFYKYNDNNSRIMKVQEIKLNSPVQNLNFELYKKTYKNDISYSFKIYKNENNIITTYFDEIISFQNYLDLISKYKGNNTIHYLSLSFIQNLQEYNVKFYDTFTTLEYEENKLNNKFIMPDCIKIKKEEKEKQLLKR